MKKLTNLKGAKALSRNQQKSIHGGGSRCATEFCNNQPNGVACNSYGFPGCCSHGCCRPNPNPTFECIGIIDHEK